jgi:hypothetical protein
MKKNGQHHGRRVWAILAEYDSPAKIYDACEKVRASGLTHFDAYTPFPVHGLDKAMGLRASRLPWMVLCAGIFGGTFLFGFEFWASAIDLPLNIAGKPTFSGPAFIPPAFEFTILLAALTAVFGMLYLNGLPRLHHPLFASPRFDRATNDKFFVAVEASDPRFDQALVEGLLRATNASHVEIVEHEHEA